MVNIILLGSQGSGKGTQGEMIVEKYKLASISMGELLREEISKKTKIGMKISSFVNNGDLVPDEITFELFKKRIKKKDCKNGYLLDGFPRDLEQAKYLSQNFKFDYVFLFEITDKVAVERIANRRTCEKCGEVFHLIYKKPKKANVCDSCNGKLVKRVDDKPITIKKRLKLYHENILPILKCFDKKIIYKIDATKDISKIFKKVEKIIDKK